AAYSSPAAGGRSGSPPPAEAGRGPRPTRALESSIGGEGLSGEGDRRHELVLVRHGETDWSRAGKHTGRTDVPLNEAGQANARALAGSLAGRRFALVLTSPLSRAIETCRLAGLGDRAQVRDE